MIFLLKYFVFWLVFQYVVTPFIIKFTLTAPERYFFPKLEWSSLVSSLGTKFQSAHNALLELGFSPADATQIPRVQVVIYVHPNDGSIVELRHTKSGVSLCFIQEYEAHTRLHVTNSPLPSVHPKLAKSVGYGLNIIDVSRLFEVFVTIRSKTRLGNAIPAVSEFALQRTEDFANDQLIQLIEKGVYSRKVSNGKRRVSFKQACLMTWKLAWPSKPIILFFRNRQGVIAAMEP